MVLGNPVKGHLTPTKGVVDHRVRITAPQALAAGCEHPKPLSDAIQLCAHLDRKIQKVGGYGSPQQVAEDKTA